MNNKSGSEKLISILFMLGIIGYLSDGTPIFESSDRVTIYKEDSVVGEVIYEQHGNKPPVIDKTGEIIARYIRSKSDDITK